MIFHYLSLPLTISHPQTPTNSAPKDAPSAIMMIPQASR
uniref:Uncharacterized protein n=1 Tax=Moniliophthora roreri TaxID=221103 RepID=A0A0W0FWE7_MONRR